MASPSMGSTTTDGERHVQYMQCAVRVKECMSIDLCSHRCALLGLPLCFRVLCWAAIYFFISPLMCLLLLMFAFPQPPSPNQGAPVTGLTHRHSHPRRQGPYLMALSPQSASLPTYLGSVTPRKYSKHRFFSLTVQRCFTLCFRPCTLR